MRRYAVTLLIFLLGTLGLFSGFNLLVDPFGNSRAPALPGLTSADTRLLEDGGRVHIADRLARGGIGSAILGSSRTVDGFPVEPENWPGGVINAGMRGTNMFELGRAMALAARDPELRCLVIGLDMDEFGTHSKAKATYWLSALADGNQALATARTSLSPSTFGASLQLIGDNLTGNRPRLPWSDSYEPGQQLARFESGIRGIYRYYLGYQFDPERLDYFEHALDALTASGVQVVGFIHPLHAWREEAMFRTGRSGDYFNLRQDLTALFALYADRDAASPCSGNGAAVLWDFSGYQPPATRPAPGSDQTAAHTSFYEPSHYLRPIGQAMLDRMSRNAPESSDFGVRLTPQTLASSESALRERRAAWLISNDGKRASRLLAEIVAEQPDAELSPPQFLNTDDWRGLDVALGRLPDPGTRRLHQDATTR